MTLGADRPDGAIPAPVHWAHRHLLDVDGLTRPEIELVMKTTD